MDLAGLAAVLACRYDDDEPGSPWDFFLYLDERADAVAWLHEALAWTGVAEEDLLLAGLTSEQLRALRLMNLGNLGRAIARISGTSS